MAAILPISREKNPRRLVAPGHRRVAAIDIGSNSIRQIVADVSPEGAIQVVDEMKAAPRLAAGLSSTGALAEMTGLKIWFEQTPQYGLRVWNIPKNAEYLSTPHYYIIYEDTNG